MYSSKESISGEYGRVALAPVIVTLSAVVRHFKVIVMDNKVFHTWPEVWKTNLITPSRRLPIILASLNWMYGHSENIGPVASYNTVITVMYIAVPYK